MLSQSVSTPSLALSQSVSTPSLALSQSVSTLLVLAWVSSLYEGEGGFQHPNTGLAELGLAVFDFSTLFVLSFLGLQIDLSHAILIVCRPRLWLCQRIQQIQIPLDHCTTGRGNHLTWNLTSPCNRQFSSGNYPHKLVSLPAYPPRHSLIPLEQGQRTSLLLPYLAFLLLSLSMTFPLANDVPEHLDFPTLLSKLPYVPLMYRVNKWH